MYIKVATKWQLLFVQYLCIATTHTRIYIYIYIYYSSMYIGQLAVIIIANS